MSKPVFGEANAWVRKPSVQAPTDGDRLILGGLKFTLGFPKSKSADFSGQITLELVLQVDRYGKLPGRWIRVVARDTAELLAAINGVYKAPLSQEDVDALCQATPFYYKGINWLGRERVEAMGDCISVRGIYPRGDGLFQLNLES